MSLRTIGVLTSGGDGPGLNAAIRAVVRTALSHDFRVMGVKGGYMGLVNGELENLDARSVGGVLGQGGTILGTTRCPEFKSLHGRREALRTLNEYAIDALIVIGGNGSLTGALKLHEGGFPVMGVPATIDNDLAYTDLSIGVDTALNTILNYIDKIRDTASAHRRAFLIETMGRGSGYLALMGGIAGGAEMVCIPEKPVTIADVEERLKDAYDRGKAHCIIVVAEGIEQRTAEIAAHLRQRKDETGFEVMVTILGHLQRGGSPTAFDRLLATRLGAAAVQALVKGSSGMMAGLIGNQIKCTPLETVLATSKEVDLDLYELGETLEK